ncbi:MAG: ParB/RepB/Spo0J family partition protein [Candidatus Aminicenantales bacterium]
MRLRTISLKAIDLEDKRFCLSPVINFQLLVSSIREAGLLLPPVVRETDGGFILISGWKRVLACQQLSLTSFPVLILPGNTSDLEAFLRCLEENLSQRPLSLAEKIEAVNKLAAFGLSPTEVVKKFMPRLTLPASHHYYQFFLNLGRSQAPEFKKFLHETEIPLEALEILASFSEPGWRLLFPYLKSLSFSRRREIILDLEAVILREKLTIGELLGAAEIKTILEAEEIPPRRKAEALAEWLHRRRYPLVAAWEEEMERRKKEIGWPKEIKLVFDPTFEDDSLRVSFGFRSGEEFLSRLEKLKAIAAKPGFRQLFRRSL